MIYIYKVALFTSIALSLAACKSYCVGRYEQGELLAYRLEKSCADGLDVRNVVDKIGLYPHISTYADPSDWNVLRFIDIDSAKFYEYQSRDFVGVEGIVYWISRNRIYGAIWLTDAGNTAVYFEGDLYD